MQRAKEIVGALWTLATIVTGFYSFAHIESTFWLLTFVFFMGVGSMVIGYQMFFWTEKEIFSIRRRYWGKDVFDETRERREIKDSLSYYRFRGLMGMIFGISSIGFLIMWGTSFPIITETDQLIVRALQNKLSSLESFEVSYYRNSVDCKKLIYANSWFAEPRSYECGRGDNGHYPTYGQFSSDAESLFEKVNDALDIGGVEFSEARIDYTSDAKIKRAEFFFNSPLSKIGGYLYAPLQEGQTVEKSSYYQHVSENWYVILNHSSAF